MLKSTSHSLLFVSLAAIAFSSMSTVAYAQEADVSDEGGLEDIIVTARMPCSLAKMLQQA